MRAKNSLLVIIFSSLLIVASCKKEPEENCDSCPVGGSTEPIGFSYIKNSGATIYADSAFFNSSYRTITAYYHGIATRINIKTSSQAEGTYSLTIPGNTISYTETTATYIASDGSINITSNLNNKMSGNFVSNGTGAGIITLRGQFKDISKK
jgi:hypothetical protein